MKKRWFLILGVGLLAVGLINLWTNYRLAADLRSQLIQIDQHSADPSAIKAQLTDLAAHHMGTSGSVFFETGYNKAVATAQAAAAGSNANGAVYAQAQTACAGKADSIVQARCVASYVASHTTPGTGPQAAVMPVKSDYTFAVKSPVWTPDLAGIALVAGAVVLLGGLAWSLRRR